MNRGAKYECVEKNRRRGRGSQNKNRIITGTNRAEPSKIKAEQDQNNKTRTEQKKYELSSNRRTCITKRTNVEQDENKTRVRKSRTKSRKNLEQSKKI